VCAAVSVCIHELVTANFIYKSPSPSLSSSHLPPSLPPSLPSLPTPSSPIPCSSLLSGLPLSFLSPLPLRPPLGNDRYSHPEQAERLRSDLVHLTGSFDRLDVWRDTIKKKGQKSLHSPLYVLFVTAKLWLVCS